LTIERHDVGPRMSQCVVHNDTVYLAGQVDRSGSRTVKDQTKRILEQVDKLLEKAGSDKSKLLSANIWLADIRFYAEMNEVWDAWVSPGNTPARACVEARLAGTEFLVEIGLTAAR
jgi:enamine deaminase RidA (YjgF/YER057c/UK114 family)